MEFRVLNRPLFGASRPETHHKHTIFYTLSHTNALFLLNVRVDGFYSRYNLFFFLFLSLVFYQFHELILVFFFFHKFSYSSPPPPSSIILTPLCIFFFTSLYCLYYWLFCFFGQMDWYSEKGPIPPPTPSNQQRWFGAYTALELKFSPTCSEKYDCDLLEDCPQTLARTGSIALLRSKSNN